VRHHYVGDHARLQAAHPIAEHHLRYSTDLFKTLGQQGQRRGARLIGAETDKAHAAPGQHGAEQVAAGIFGPIDDQVLARCWQPRTIGPPLLVPAGFGLGHRPTKEVGLADGQLGQPLVVRAPA
jgi:hypothetical protein